VAASTAVAARATTLVVPTFTIMSVGKGNFQRLKGITGMKEE
jgi:hypothetical protein